MPKFWERGAEGSKSQKMFLLNPIDRNPKLYNITKKQSPKAIKRGDMRVFLLFELEKRMILTYLPSILS